MRTTRKAGSRHGRADNQRKVVKADFKRLESWEIRGSRTKKRGTIYLIQSGSSHIMGQVDIVDCIELTKERYEKTEESTV